MNAPERATLRELFAEIGSLRDRMDERFDGVETRMRTVEQDLGAYRAVEAERKEHKVSIRWGVSSIISIVSIAAGVAATVVTVLLRLMAG